MVFSATWFLLEQEGFLAQACLCNGLTALRHANLGDKKGLFYSAFFELSTGFERTLKLILILDHMAQNQPVPPNSKTVEDYGHKLCALFDKAKAICAARRLTALDAFLQDSLPLTLLHFLNEFAHPSGRYSNINKLTDHKFKYMADPLIKWGEIASQIMKNHATPGQRNQAKLNGQLASAASGDTAASLISDMNQQQMDVARLFTRTSELDSAARHAIYALVMLIAALREVIDSLCDSVRKASAASLSSMSDIPNMNEFFQFAWADKKYVMRKRRWP